MKRAILAHSGLCVGLVGVALAVSTAAQAVPIVAFDPYAIRDVFGPNTVEHPPARLSPPGGDGNGQIGVSDNLQIGVRVEDTTRSFTPAGTVVTATNSNAPATTFTLTGPTPQDPLFPNLFYKWIPYDSNLAGGSWTFTARNNGDTATAGAGPNLAPSVPLATNLQVAANGLLPTVTWDFPGFVPVGGFPGVDIDQIQFRAFVDTDNTQFLRKVLPADATSYTLQPGELPGAGDFTFRVMLDDFGTGGDDGQSRSNAFVNHSIAPDEISLVASGPFHIRDARSTNSAGWGVGDRLVVGADYVLPSGDEIPMDGFADNPGAPKPPTSGVARQYDGGNVTAETDLLFYPSAGFPNQFVRSVAYDPVLATNPWELTFTNGSDLAILYTPVPGAGAPLPFVENVAFAPNGTTPSFNWTIPATSTNTDLRFEVLDVENFLSIGAAPRVFQARRLGADATDYTLPDGFLLPNHQYSAMIVLEERQGGILRSTSRAFFDFSTGVIALPAGAPAGASVFLPNVNPTGGPTGSPLYEFAIDVAGAETIFIDPEIAIGYDYAIGPGDPFFTSVLLPDIGDGLFDLWLFDPAGDPFDTLIDVGQGIVFDFTTQLSGFQSDLGYDPSGGIDRFRILGIETSAGLDPNDATAFATGLTFAADGRFTGTMTPITTSVPEPPTLAVLLVGLTGLGVLVLVRRRTGVA
jgi:hypothetical protein